MSKSKIAFNSHKRMLFEEAQHKCYYCGVPVSLRSMTVDHIIPHGFGGGISSYDNKVCSCPRCNNQKGILTIDEFISKWKPERRRKYLGRVEKDYQEGQISTDKYLRLVGKKTSEGLMFISKIRRRFHWRGIHISVIVWVSSNAQ